MTVKYLIQSGDKYLKILPLQKQAEFAWVENPENCYQFNYPGAASAFITTFKLSQSKVVAYRH